MVRLGSDDALERGRLAPKAMVEGDRRDLALRRRRSVARCRTHSRTSRPSAVREADNGDEFRAQVEAQAGIPFRDPLRAGRGAAHTPGHRERFPDLRPARVHHRHRRRFDRIHRRRRRTAVSVRQRQAREPAPLRPLLAREVDATRGARTRPAYSRHAEPARRPGSDAIGSTWLIGTSGTIMGLAAIDAAAARPPRFSETFTGTHVTRRRLEEIQRQMLAMTESERRRMPGMNPRRSDIIVAGNAILIAALTQLGRDEIVVCERALRDGIIVDMASQDRALAERLGDERARRIEAIEALGPPLRTSQRPRTHGRAPRDRALRAARRRAWARAVGPRHSLRGRDPALDRPVRSRERETTSTRPI